MSESIEIREHSTADIDFQLLSGGDAIDLTNIDHIEMEMRDARRGVYSYTSASGATLTITGITTGNVRFTPANNSIFIASKSPYRGYWRVYTTSEKSFTCPDDDEFIIFVREEF